MTSMKMKLRKFRNYSLKGQELLDLGDNFDTSSVKKMNGMFANFGTRENDSNLRLGRAFSFKSVDDEVTLFVYYSGLAVSEGTIYVPSEEVKEYFLQEKFLAWYHNIVVESRSGL